MKSKGSNLQRANDRAAANARNDRADKVKTETEALEAATKMAVRNALLKGWRPFLQGYKEKGHTQKQCFELAQAAAVMLSLVALTVAGVSSRKMAGLEVFSKILSSQKIKYLPCNARIIDRKINEVMNGKKVKDVIRLYREGNTNAQKETTKRPRKSGKGEGSHRIDNWQPEPEAA